MGNLVYQQYLQKQKQTKHSAPIYLQKKLCCKLNNEIYNKFQTKIILFNIQKCNLPRESLPCLYQIRMLSVKLPIGKIKINKTETVIIYNA